MQERERPGDRLVAADEAVGGIAAEGGERGAVAEAHGRIGGPKRHDDCRGRSAAGEQRDGGEAACSGVGSPAMPDSIQAAAAWAARSSAGRSRAMVHIWQSGLFASHVERISSLQTLLQTNWRSSARTSSISRS
jgi:hypothetical protein